MKISKITQGYVLQTYDTETGKCKSQEFIAGDECEYETEYGEHFDIDDIHNLFKEIHNAMAEDGILIIEVPHADFRDHDYEKNRLYFMYHLFKYFTKHFITLSVMNCFVSVVLLFTCTSSLFF